MPEPQHVHGIFRVIPKLFNEFDTVHITLATLADKPLSLRFQLSKGPIPRVSRSKCRREFLKFFPNGGSDHHSKRRPS